MGPGRSLSRSRVAYLVLSAIALGAIAFTWLWLMQRDFLNDARAYWSVDYADMYGNSLVGRFGTYLYSPAFAHALWPATLLPWAVFAGAWCALNLGLLVWMAGPIVTAVLLFVPFSPVTDEVTTGNVHILIAAAVVAGFRHPAAWALPVLTKVTPGVGVLWFAGAARWRALATALGVTAGVALVSFLIAPAQWSSWTELLSASAGVAPGAASVIPGPLWLRGSLAAVLVLAGGRLGWKWTVPVSATLALPVTWSSGLSILVALIPLYRDRLTGLRPRAIQP
jgi:hypothetical protein